MTFCVLNTVGKCLGSQVYGAVPEKKYFFKAKWCFQCTIVVKNIANINILKEGKGRVTLSNQMNFRKNSKWPSTPPTPPTLMTGKLYCFFFGTRLKKTFVKVHNPQYEFLDWKLLPLWNFSEYLPDLVAWPVPKDNHVQKWLSHEKTQPSSTLVMGFEIRIHYLDC